MTDSALAWKELEKDLLQRTDNLYNKAIELNLRKEVMMDFVYK